MDIRPIHTEADYEEALQVIDALFDAEPGTTAGDHLDVLTTLVEAYEREHYPVPVPDPVEAILYFMESRGLSRPLSLEMRQRLHTNLGISAEAFVQPYALASGGKQSRR